MELIEINYEAFAFKMLKCKRGDRYDTIAGSEYYGQFMENKHQHLHRIIMICIEKN